jgi:dynein intermediate chain
MHVFLLELSEEERASVLTAPEFLDFVEQSSKIVQRALNDGYDYIRDYTIGTETGVYVYSCIHCH